MQSRPASPARAITSKTGDSAGTEPKTEHGRACACEEDEDVARQAGRVQLGRRGHRSAHVVRRRLLQVVHLHPPAKLGFGYQDWSAHGCMHLLYYHTWDACTRAMLLPKAQVALGF